MASRLRDLLELLDAAVLLVAERVERLGRLTLAVRDVDAAEEETGCLEAWADERCECEIDDLAHGVEADVEKSEGRRPEPDGAEGDRGEVAAPAETDADTAAVRGDLVEEVEAAVEAAVRVAPHAVGRVGSLRLREHVVELDLNVAIHAIGISLDQIDFFVGGRHLE